MISWIVPVDGDCISNMRYDGASGDFPKARTSRISPERNMSVFFQFVEPIPSPVLQLGLEVVHG